MTRINVVPVTELCDQHLFAEFRELSRIPNTLVSGKLSPDNTPLEYTLGKGHVKWAANHLTWLYKRYMMLFDECRERGYSVTWKWNSQASEMFPDLWNDYTPTQEALNLNRGRIQERMPVVPRFHGEKLSEIV